MQIVVNKIAVCIIVIYGNSHEDNSVNIGSHFIDIQIGGDG